MCLCVWCMCNNMNIALLLVLGRLLKFLLYIKRMSKSDFDAVPDVDIDERVFKYVYIRYVVCPMSNLLFVADL